ncbi:MAG: FtsX-like permease family protein [Acidobacteriota bacterium]
MSKSTARGVRMRRFLVVMQIAVALTLLVGAGLLIKSFSQLLSVDPGFTPKNVLTMEVHLPPIRYPQPHQTTAFFQRSLEEIRTLPGVRSAATTWKLPLTSDGGTAGMQIVGQAANGPDDRKPVLVQAITPGYFRTLGIPLLRGRELEERDNAEAPGVVLINEAAAQRYWPNQDPVGERVQLEVNFGPGGMLPPGEREVVGVVASVRQNGLDKEAEPELYFPTYQSVWRMATFVIETDGTPHAVSKPAVDAIRSIDPELAVGNIRTAKELIDGSVKQPRAWMWLMALLAVVALVLAAVGIYGVISYAVTRRVKELGLRMALGARQSDVLGLVLKEGAILGLVGVGIGLVLTFGVLQMASSFLAAMLFEVSPSDLPVVLTVCLTLALLSIFASFIPARRATQVDPWSVLRQ